MPVTEDTRPPIPEAAMKELRSLVGLYDALNGYAGEYTAAVDLDQLKDALAMRADADRMWLRANQYARGVAAALGLDDHLDLITAARVPA